MTVPEENREKTEKTEDALTRPDAVARDRQEERERRERGPSEGATMREALEDAGVTPEDFEGRGEGSAGR